MNRDGTNDERLDPKAVLASPSIEVPFSKLIPANESPYTRRNLEHDWQATLSAILADPVDREAFLAPLGRDGSDAERNRRRTEVWSRRFGLQSLANVTEVGVEVEQGGQWILVRMAFADGTNYLRGLDREAEAQRR